LLVIVLVTLLALWPVATFDFTIWDDNGTITGNPNLNPPTFAGLIHHWTHFRMELYVPVTYTMWWLLANVARVSNETGGPSLNPWIFHGANLVLHVLAACAAWRFLTRLGLRAWPAAAGALVFAVHPVQVETVAWVSGLKDLLSGLLVIVALDQYLAATKSSSRPYFFSMIAFAAAMLAKPTAVAMPLITLALDVLFVRKSLRDTLRSVAPFAVLAVPCLIVGKFAQPSSLIAPIPLWWRPFVAGDAVAFYLWKIFWPANLGIDYGRMPQSVIDSRVAFITSITVFVLVVAFSIFGRNRKRDVAGVATFLAALAPVVGLIPFEFQAKSTVADHYLYVPMLGIALLVAMSTDHLARHARGATILIGSIVIVALAGRSWAQTWHWRDSRTLFEHAIAVNERSTIGPFNLVFYWLGVGRPDLAEPYARRMMELKPDEPWSHLHLATALAQQRRYADAERLFRAATRRWPDNAEAHGGLGSALLDLNRPAEALAEFDEALRITPDNPSLRELRNRAAATIATQPARP
jgi:hypothetical protein